MCKGLCPSCYFNPCCLFLLTCTKALSSLLAQPWHYRWGMRWLTITLSLPASRSLTAKMLCSPILMILLSPVWMIRHPAVRLERVIITSKCNYFVPLTSTVSAVNHGAAIHTRCHRTQSLMIVHSRQLPISPREIPFARFIYTKSTISLH